MTFLPFRDGCARVHRTLTIGLCSQKARPQRIRRSPHGRVVPESSAAAGVTRSLTLISSGGITCPCARSERDEFSRHRRYAADRCCTTYRHIGNSSGAQSRSLLEFVPHLRKFRRFRNRIRQRGLLPPSPIDEEPSPALFLGRNNSSRNPGTLRGLREPEALSDPLMR